MSAKKYSPPLKYFNLLGASELRQGRLMVAFVVVTIVLVAVVYSLVRMNTELQETNRILQDSRVMIGYPNSEGVFVSEKMIPDRHIIAFVTTFLDNYYNFTPDSATTNAEEALRMMSSRLRSAQEEGLKIVANQSIEQQITQVFAKSSQFKIEMQPNLGYIVSFTGERHRATMGNSYKKTKYQIKILIKPVKPSKYYEWAVVVDDFMIQEI
jgi:hypothetical protein